MDAPASTTSPRTKLRLLVLDGGGMRGVGTLFMLQKLKSETGLDISDFDMIGGTSAGGLIALAALLGLGLEEIEKLFLKIGQDIFTSSWTNTASYRAQAFVSLVTGSKAGGKYSTADYTASLSSALEQYGDPNSTLAQLGKRKQPAVFAVASDITFNSSVSPFIMRSYEHRRQESEKTMHDPVLRGTSEMSLLTAAVSTSAAPTYFDAHVPWQGKGEGVTFLVDGGVGFNNPIFLAIHELKRTFGWDAEVELVVSIGTGLPTMEVSERVKSVLDWKSTVVNLATEGDFIHKNFQLMRPVLAGFDDSIYARFNPPDLGGIAMDDPSEQTLTKIRKLAQTYMEGKEAVAKMRQVRFLLSQQQASSSTAPTNIKRKGSPELHKEGDEERTKKPGDKKKKKASGGETVDASVRQP